MFSYLILSFVIVSQCYCNVFILQADTDRTAGNHEMKHYTNASDGKAVIVTPTRPFSINFCLREKTKVSLTNLRFSHGNSSALFTVSLDHGYWMGTYFSPPSDSWNHFHNTGKFPREYDFESGWHVLKVNVSEGYSNIAIDNAEFDVKDEWMTQGVLTCETVCLDSPSFPQRKDDDNLPHINSPARLEQRSFQTTCAEVDNVDVPIYHPFVEKFSIKATLPQYRSFANRRAENLTGCPHLSPVLWKFEDFHIDSKFKEINDNKNALLIHNPNFDNSTSNMLLVVLFKLEGQKKGSIDAKIGSSLFLRFKRLKHPVKVTMRYRGQAGNMSSPVKKLFDPSALENHWSIPDFTWTENEDNYIVLDLNADVRINFDVDNLRLERRPMLPEQVITIYKSDDVIIEAVLIEFWWLAPDSMTVRLANGKTINNVAYLRLYRPVPWNMGYAQVFVLYQDGNCRLLPLAPEGLDWIPFGTSVILGQTYSDSIRPYVSITEVHITPELWEMNVFYKDGGSLKLKLFTTYSDTTAVAALDGDYIEYRFYGVESVGSDGFKSSRRYGGLVYGRRTCVQTQREHV
ncbi:hypothetical protein KUTeg_023995 [Tegillarca granosa]|uniref:Uncharacterized protein n=1 Tax=Tegillarca granosa TaxID=220873 RepID=A0ABQ9E0A0_TEGGR|nr:hypothetical protein KUTeg_023995 [Tegillarca granosa]